MNAQQIPCSSCGQMVWLNPQSGGYCGRCGSAIAPAQASMPQQPPMPGQPPMPQMPMTGGGLSPQQSTPLQQAPAGSGPGGYGLPKKKMLGIAGGAILVAALGIGGTIVKKKFGKAGKESSSYGYLEVDPKKADPDDLIDASSELAIKKWNRDAAWWSANFHGIRPDGTMDLTAGAIAKVTYISPRRVKSASRKLRKDSIKKFSFGPKKVNYRSKWDARRRWKNVTLPGDPQCGVRALTMSLVQSGFARGTIRVSFDPKFAFVADAYAWRVTSKEHPELDGSYSMVDCSLLKAAPPKPAK